MNASSLSSRPWLPLRARGFSVMEMVVLISVIGVLITVALTMFGTQPLAVRNTKLSSDVATLNQMVAVYVADGGSVSGLTDPQAVLDKMKRSRPQTEWNRHNGPATGRLLDNRLRARITSASESDQLERARWNTQKQRFEITKGSGTAVSDFYLDETLATKDYGTEARETSVVKYNSVTGKNQGWVWGSSTSGNINYNTPGSTGGNGVSNPFDPTKPAVDPPGSGSGSGDGSGSGNGNGNGSGTGTGGENAATALPKPTISPSGGSYAYSSFPGYVTFGANGAPSDGSSLEYRINGGSWQTYSPGSPVPVASADKVDARNRATNTTLYKTSATTSSSYYRLSNGFSGTGSGTWGNATGGPNLVTSVQNSETQSTFKHGNTKLDLGNGEYLDAGVENVLTFDRESFDTVLPNTWFELGTLAMLNGTTFYNSEADGVTLSVNLNLTDPAQTGVVHINLGLISTDNSSDRNASADIVELQNPTTDFTVTVDGVEYRLELSWASLDPSSGYVQGNQFYIYEGSTATASLRARFTAKTP